MTNMPRPLTVRAVMLAVQEIFHVEREVILGYTKSDRDVIPRHVAFYLARQCTKMSFPKLAKSFNRVDHTSIMHGNSRVEAMVEVDEVIRNQVQRVKDLLAKQGYDLTGQITRDTLANDPVERLRRDMRHMHNSFFGFTAMAQINMMTISSSPTTTPETKALADRISRTLDDLKTALETRVDA